MSARKHKSIAKIVPIKAQENCSSCWDSGGFATFAAPSRSKRVERRPCETEEGGTILVRTGVRHGFGTQHGSISNDAQGAAG